VKLPFADHILCRLLLDLELAIASSSNPIVALTRSHNMSLASSDSPFKKWEYLRQVLTST